MPPPKDPRPFATRDAFRAWLARHHAREEELFVRCYRSHAADLGMTYLEALDEALCHGWIDGVRHRLDAASFSVRFTPRKPKSIWSRVNVRKAEALIADGRMAAAGLAAYAARSEERTGVYSFERPPARLAPEFARCFRADRKAWRWFESQAPWYRRTATHYVMSAKQEATRLRRFETLLAASRAGQPIAPLKRQPG